MHETLRFEFVDGTAELVAHGSPRYRELIADGHTPVGSIPPSDGISDTLQEYLDGRFGAVPAATVAAVDADPDSVFRVQQDARHADLYANKSVETDVSDLQDVVDTGRLSATTLPATYARKRERDPRDFGLTGGADDSAALQACIDDAGPGGTVVLPDNLVINYASSLVLPTGLYGVEIRGAGNKGSVLQATTDVSCITAESGHGWVLRNFIIRNSATSRATWDIDMVNPTKPVLEDVEIECVGQPTGVGGGIRLLADTGKSGNAFMPQLSRVWLRQASLVIDGVTDGHFVDGFVWAADTKAAAINLKATGGWTFAGVDVVPSDGAGCGYFIDSSKDIQIVGGYMDGSYSSNITGHGISMLNSSRVFISGYNFLTCGRSALRMENTTGCVVTGTGFRNHNKQDANYPDIDLINSDFNTFTSLSHSQSIARTNKGAIYREDSASTNNLYDTSVYDSTLGTNYASPAFVGNANTQGRRNRPGSLWPRPTGVASIVVPPATTFDSGAAAAWAAANRAQFHRFHLTEGGAYRYANLRVESGSGNFQCAVVKMDGLNYTRVMTSGIVACTTGGQAVDMGATYLEPGEYALVVWVDNTTALLWRASSEMIRGARLTTEVSSLATGVPSTGSIAAWSTPVAVVGLTLSA